MNKTKKLISLLLAVVLIMAFPATAFATDRYDNAFVDGYYNQSHQYCVRIGNFGMSEVMRAYINLMEEYPNDACAFAIRCTFFSGDDPDNCDIYDLYCMPTQDSCYAALLIDGQISDYHSDIINAAAYAYDTDLIDAGVVVVFDGDAGFLEVLKKCKAVVIQTYLSRGTDIYGIGEDEITAHTIATNFQGLDEPVADEPVVDEPVTNEPVVDEPIADEPVADEPVVDEPVADEPAADEPAADEPAADEPVADEPAADTPVVDTNNTVDTGKDNPDTGAEGIAAIAAIGITAIGAALLSKKKK